MKVLMINKFLYPNGGSETYIFKLGDYLKNQGHEVQYFGMEHEGRCVGNSVNAYTSDMDFHGGSKLSNLTYPLKTIYSSEARKKIRLVLDDFQPDVCHINNFNYQLTPSIILEIEKWRKEGYKCQIVFTAHDYQLVCPNHQLKNPNTHENCEKCLGGHFINCVKGKCIHGSAAKSAVGMMEAVFWKWNGVYKYIDTIICCSEFLKTKMDTNPLFAKKTVAIHNFVEKIEPKEVKKKNYILYFGRFSEEKGINTLVETCRALPDINFVFAGSGPLENKVNNIENITNVGFQTGEALDNLIREARFSICPSEVYENCPFSIMESQQRGTPVIGSNLGGIPELITDRKNGRIFASKDSKELAAIILELWNNPETVEDYSKACLNLLRDDLSSYYEKLLPIYRGGGLILSELVNIDYVLYFGRFSKEKGIGTLIEVCKELPDVQFIFAGTGPLENEINGIPNIKNVGFQSGKVLETLIREARFSVYPSEWYENCPFSVMESQMYGTPVIGARIGGIPELIKDKETGELFESGNAEMLKSVIEKLWNDKELNQRYVENCKNIQFDSVSEYTDKLIKIYMGR